MIALHSLFPWLWDEQSIQTQIYASIGSDATQYVNINVQLNFGIRYFNVRPILFQGQWSCGHWTSYQEADESALVHEILG